MNEEARFIGVDQTRALAEEFSAIFPEAYNELFGEAGPAFHGELEKFYLLLAKRGGPTALCLSGGGIRSATFSLGVLQAFAGRGWLKRFDYLSTVSGGGFTGSFLSRWRAEDPDWKEEQLSETEDNFGYQRQDVHPVRRLRSFSNYLTPRWGVTGDGLAMADEALRKFSFNFLFWVLLLLGIGCALRVVAIGLAYTTGVVLDLIGIAEPAHPIFASASAGVAGALGLGLLALLSLSIASLVGRSSDMIQQRISVAGGWVLAAIAGLAIGQTVFVWIPDMAQLWLEGTGQKLLFAASTAVVSLVAGLSGLWSRGGPALLEHARKLREMVKIHYLQLVSGLALTLLAISAGWAARNLPMVDVGAGEPQLLTGLFRYIAAPAYNDEFGTAMAGYFGYSGAFVVAACLMAVVIGPNSSSLHSIYARRLARAFLGSASNAPDPKLTDADIPLAALPGGRFDRDGRRRSDAGSRCLFHVINMTLNLSRAGGHRRDWQERRGAAFTATPLHTGSWALPRGYVRSEDLWNFETDRGLSLGRAMAISGAAASPNMGYYSRFLTALAMTLFNVRLGWWLQNPGRMREGGSLFEQPRLGFFQAWREAFSVLDEKSGWVYLSDGGHFDNLGLYEMVRRRCAQILVVDAGCDGAFEYDDLHRALRKIQVDFGIPVDLPGSLPGQPGAGQDQRFVVGIIRYSVRHPGMADGRLILLKPRMTGEEPPTLAHYRAQSSSGRNQFPHHSTADQFFDETQFESYRVLGWLSGEVVTNALPEAFSKSAEYDDRFYPSLKRAEQPSVQARDSAMPSLVSDPSRQPERGGDENSRPARGRGAIAELAGSVRQWTAGELVTRTVGAVALVGVTGGIAVNAGDKLVDAVVQPAAGFVPASGAAMDAREGDDDQPQDKSVIDPDTEGSVAGVDTKRGLDTADQGKDGDTLERELEKIRADIASLRRRIDEVFARPVDPRLANDLRGLQARLDSLQIPRDQSGRRDFEIGDLRNRLAWLTARLDALDPVRTVRPQ